MCSKRPAAVGEREKGDEGLMTCSIGGTRDAGGSRCGSDKAPEATPNTKQKGTDTAAPESRTENKAPKKNGLGRALHQGKGGKTTEKKERKTRNLEADAGPLERNPVRFFWGGWGVWGGEKREKRRKEAQTLTSLHALCSAREGKRKRPFGANLRVISNYKEERKMGRSKGKRKTVIEK